MEIERHLWVVGAMGHQTFAPRKTLEATGAAELHNECFSINMALQLQL